MASRRFSLLINMTPLSETEAKERMRNCLSLIEELEYRKAQKIKAEEEEELTEIFDLFKEDLKNLNEDYNMHEQELMKESLLNTWKLQHANHMQISEEMDKIVLEVILAVHHRLGRVDHTKHKKAYRRILYALVVQGLCRIMESKAVCIFREADIELGKSVVSKAEKKYKLITGLKVKVLVDEMEFLPLESCGGVDVKCVKGKTIVSNSLSVRLDQLLNKAQPMIRIALFGRNLGRKFYDLSVMSGSPTLFLWPTISSSDEATNSSEDVAVDVKDSYYNIWCMDNAKNMKENYQKPQLLVHDKLLQLEIRFNRIN